MKHKLFTFFLVLAASIGITNAAIVNGTCGDNLTWSLNTKDSTLIIEGSGKMTEAPWRSYASYIAYVSLPDGLTNIYSYAFSGCSLTFVDIPNSVTTIGDGAFQGCSNLTSVIIPNNVTSIGDFAFQNCIDLTSVTIGKSVTYIGLYAFFPCENLTKVNISDLTAWCNISFSSYEANPLYYGPHLFMDNKEVIDLVIPNDVTSIETWAFIACSSLASVTIPNSVTSIGAGAFAFCSLSQITCEATVSPIINEDTFRDVDKTIPLFVPEESVETYANAFYWEAFTNILAIGTIIGTYSVEFRDWDGTVLKTETVNHGSAAEAPEDPYREGYTFIGWDVDFNSVKEDLIVTAQYELGENKTFQISFNDKDNNIIIQNEVVLKVPAAPEIEGFTFLGWRPVANIIEYNYIEIEAVYESDDSTSAPAEVVNPRNATQKLIREGNVYILRDNGTYTATGLKVE